MPFFHATARVLSRSNGQSAIAASAYRSGGKIDSEPGERSFDFRHKNDVIHDSVMLPAGAPDAFADPAVLWRAAEAAERRCDSQLAREFEASLPRELPDHVNIELARRFVAECFVSDGMCAQVSVHKPTDSKGARPHMHALLATREVTSDGFGLKNRAWNNRETLVRWRETWAARVNEQLARHGIEARIDHRSHAERGIELRPKGKVSRAARELEVRGQPTRSVAAEQKVLADNGKLLMAKPWLGLDYLTQHQSTFTKHDVARFIGRNTGGAEQFAIVMARMMAHPDLVHVGEGKRGEARYSTRHMIAVERRMAEHGAALAAARSHGTTPGDCRGGDGLTLGPEQRIALAHILGTGGLKLVTGYAGTGKSRLLGVARERWEVAGYRVQGAALSGIAAENLESGSGIKSRTLASLEWAMEAGHLALTNRHVLVIDEAAMVGSRQLARVIAAARQAGAKVVLVGDPEQLQAISAGAPFRLFAERHGCAHLTVVMRQQGKHAGWMREATKELATGRTAQALDRYEAAGMVHASETREQAMVDLVERWDRDRLYMPRRSQIILALTRDDVANLNDLARQAMRRANSLEGEDVTITTTRGVRAVAKGDRLMFLKNDRGLGVKNGTLGTLQEIKEGKLTIALDDGSRLAGGRSVTVGLAAYNALEHGYASTVHKSQGVTVGRSYIMAGKAFDRHSAYVAMTRHRGRADMHFARSDFKDRAALMATMARARAKDVTNDYARGGRFERVRQAAMEVAARRAATHSLRPQQQSRMREAVNRAVHQMMRGRDLKQERSR